MRVNLNVSGFDTLAEFPDQNVEHIHRPLVELFTQQHRAKLHQSQSNQRTIVFLCAPPGSGKSTLAAFWERLSLESCDLESLQVLPFDGFHYPNQLLDQKTTQRDGKEIPLRSIKGSYETFDLKELSNKLKQLKTDNPKWPYYDRNLHDPVQDAITVDKNIVVVEGNWLLLNEPEWQELKALADVSIFIDTKPEYLKERLVNRKVRGGKSLEEALAFYEQSDAINVNKVLTNSLSADITLFMHQDGSFERIE